MLFIVFFDPKDLGCRYLSAYLEKHGYDTRILALKIQVSGVRKAEPTAEDIATRCQRVNGAKASINVVQHTEITDRELEILSDFIAEWKPDVVGIGTRSKNFKYLPRTITAIRKGNPHAFLVAGGFGPSLEPEIPLEMGVDAIIRGEGEYILSDLLARLKQGKNWKDLPGIAYMENGKPHINKVKTIELNLDNFPFPFISNDKVFIIENDHLYSSTDSDKVNTYGKGIHFILSSRGCPAECSYCGGRALRDKFKSEGVLVPRIRRRTLDNVLDELKQVKIDPEIRQIIFSDEFFIHPADKLIKFFHKYKEEVDLPFFALLSADQIVLHPDMLDAAIDAGLMYCTFGMQTGSEDFCRRVYNRKNINANILKSINMAWERGLPGWIFMILGNPLESEKYIEYTLDVVNQMPKADPSFKRRLFFETNKLGIPYGTPPIIQKYPELLNLTVTREKFYYDAMMLEFRLVLDDKDFNSLRNDELYKRSPHLLGKLYQSTTKQKHKEYLNKELNRIQGKEIYIFGGGPAYEENKHLLKDVKIRSFMIDSSYNPPDSIDGIPVIGPDSKIIDGNNPVIIMGGIDNINFMWRRIQNLQPQVTDIVTCSAFYDIL